MHGMAFDCIATQVNPMHIAPHVKNAPRAPLATEGRRASRCNVWPTARTSPPARLIASGSATPRGGAARRRRTRV